MWNASQHRSVVFCERARWSVLKAVRNLLPFLFALTGTIGWPFPIPAQQKPQPDKTEKPQEKQQEKTVEFKREIKATLGDGRIVKGSAVLAGPEIIKVKHTRSGITYDRDLRPSDIASIEVKRWKAHHLRDNKEGRVYEFRPVEFIVQTKDGGALQISADQLAFLRQIKMENENGKVTLYYIWVDLLRENGTWHTGLTGAPEKIRNSCHADTVKRLEITPEK